MVYIQLEKPKSAELLANYPREYESYSCALRYNEESLKKVDNTNLWFQGYKGSSLLTYALGLPTRLIQPEQVQDHPYVI